MQEGIVEGPGDNLPYKSRRYMKPERVSELIYEEVTDDQNRRNGRQQIPSVFLLIFVGCLYFCGVLLFTILKLQ